MTRIPREEHEAIRRNARCSDQVSWEVPRRVNEVQAPIAVEIDRTFKGSERRDCEMSMLVLKVQVSYTASGRESLISRLGVRWIGVRAEETDGVGAHDYFCGGEWCGVTDVIPVQVTVRRQCEALPGLGQVALPVDNKVDFVGLYASALQDVRSIIFTSGLYYSDGLEHSRRVHTILTIRQMPANEM